jgi:hypothetical protein
MYRFTIAVCIAMLVCLTGASLSDIPKLINYQGMLTDDLGNPLNGTVSITFRIYSDSLSASPIDKKWEETQTGVEVTNGLFNVMLGRVSSLNLDFSQDYWLDMTVGGEHLPDRIRLTSVGYAYRAQKADTASISLTTETYPHNHDDDYLNVNGTDSIRTTGTHSPALIVKTYGTGSATGIRIATPGTSATGIYIDTAGAYGIWIYRAGQEGIWIDNAEWNGIYMNDPKWNGIHVTKAGDHGLRVDMADHGVYIDSNRAGFDGIRVEWSDDDGVQVTRADYGLYVVETEVYGVLAFGDQGNHLHSEGDGYYGLEVHSNLNATDKPGLYVYGTAHCTGGWSKSVPGSSGEVPAFSVSSREVELMASGTGSLVNGEAHVSFEPEFQAAISAEVPVRVVVTAQDSPSALLYVAEKSTEGFAVKPLEIPGLSLKTDEVTFDWIAIARQKGYEQRPAVLIPSQEQIEARKLALQEKLKRDALQREEMLEKQAQREEETGRR